MCRLKDFKERAAGGFTMIEIAVILLIIAIVAAFTIPMAMSWMRAYRLGVASRNVATAVQRARYLATSNNTRAGILIAEAGRIDIQQYDPEGKTEPRQAGLVILPEGIRIHREAPEQIDFDGRGVITPLPTKSPRIRLDGADGYYQIVTVSPTGQVTVSDTMKN